MYYHFSSASSRIVEGSSFWVTCFFLLLYFFLGMDPYVYVRLCFFFFSFCILSGEKPHENVVFDPGIYVAEKEGCLFESETRSLGFLSNYVVLCTSSSLRGQPAASEKGEHAT